MRFSYGTLDKPTNSYSSHITNQQKGQANKAL